MTETCLRPSLRVVKGREPTILDDRRVVIDFTRVCQIVGIIDSSTGLITGLPRDRPEPEK